MTGPDPRGWDGPGAMGMLSAWLYEDDATYRRLLTEGGADPGPLLGGLTYLAATAVQAYAEATGVDRYDVLRLLGEITARRS